MNPLVVLFFLQNVLVSLLLGIKFAQKKDGVMKSFGIALLLDAAAFAIWSYAVISNVEDPRMLVAWGTVAFIASLVALLSAGTQQLAAGKRTPLLAAGAAIGAIIFYVGSLTAYPSLPDFSPEGFFFFNVHPLLQALYIFALVLTAVPAIEAFSAKVGGKLQSLVRYGFLAQVAGGAVLISATSNSLSAEALYVTGWIIGITYFVLWVALFFKKS